MGCCRATTGISPGCLPPFPGSNMALLTGDSPLPAGAPLSSPMLAPGGSTPDMVYFGTSRPLVWPDVLLTPRHVILLVGNVRYINSVHLCSCRPASFPLQLHAVKATREAGRQNPHAENRE